jgi:hypothetical protein
LTRIIAIDWSGDRKNAREKIWVAEVENGHLAELRNGRSPAGVVEHLVGLAQVERDLIVGFDFAFSFPAWFVEEFGTAPGLWRAIRGNEKEFWGRTVSGPFHGTHRPFDSAHGPKVRSTDHVMKAKSVFQVSGIGSVGTGSIRGMPILADLLDKGFNIWPMMPLAKPLVLEVYPRACLDRKRTRAISARFAKTNPDHRRKYLESELSGPWLDLAVCGEDSFDAATTALSMWRSLDELDHLPIIDSDTLRKEGIIWSPLWRQAHRLVLGGSA